MTFSYTQVSQYLRCPRSYRFRYLDGWREKESRAAPCFGRCFEKALAAFFEHEDAGAVLFKESRCFARVFPWRQLGAFASPRYRSARAIRPR